MDRLPPYVKPDELFRINIEGTDKFFMVNAKYDRIDFFPMFGQLGQWAIKAYDDTDGLATLYCDEETARRVADYAGLPIVQRDTALASEYQAFITAQANSLTDDMFGGFEEGE